MCRKPGVGCDWWVLSRTGWVVRVWVCAVWNRTLGCSSSLTQISSKAVASPGQLRVLQPPQDHYSLFGSQALLCGIELLTGFRLLHKRKCGVSVCNLQSWWMILVTLSFSGFSILYIQSFVYTVYDELAGQRQGPGSSGKSAASCPSDITTTEANTGEPLKHFRDVQIQVCFWYPIWFFKIISLANTNTKPIFSKH